MQQMYKFCSTQAIKFKLNIYFRNENPKKKIQILWKIDGILPDTKNYEIKDHKNNAKLKSHANKKDPGFSESDKTQLLTYNQMRKNKKNK